MNDRTRQLGGARIYAHAVTIHMAVAERVRKVFSITGGEEEAVWEAGEVRL